MKKKVKERIWCILIWTGITVFILGLLALAGFSIYVKIKFWNTPLGEIPYWATYFLFGRKE